MIDTYSLFFYGVQITAENNNIAFIENGTTLTTSISPGSYSISTLLTEIARKLNNTTVNSITYTATLNRETKLVTITSSSSMTFVNSGGESTLLTEIGFAASNSTGTTHLGTSEAVEYFEPQLLLQNYVPPANRRGIVSGSKKVSLDGSSVQVVRFGSKKLCKFNIRMQTNIDQGSGNWVKTDVSGYENLNSFLLHITEQNLIEFMPDVDTPSVYFTLLLERTPQSQDGIEYEIRERFDLGMRDYYESGVLEFRQLEV